MVEKDNYTKSIIRVELRRLSLRKRETGEMTIRRNLKATKGF